MFERTELDPRLGLALVGVKESSTEVLGELANLVDPSTDVRPHIVRGRSGEKDPHVLALAGLANRHRRLGVGDQDVHLGQ